MDKLIWFGVIMIFIGVMCIVGHYVDNTIIQINEMLKALHY